MPKLFRRDGAEVIELSKSETQRILEAKYIAVQIERNLAAGAKAQRDLVSGFIATAQAIAACYGTDHLDENGDLIQTTRQKVADEVAG